MMYCSFALDNEGGLGKFVALSSRMQFGFFKCSLNFFSYWPRLGVSWITFCIRGTCVLRLIAISILRFGFELQHLLAARRIGMQRLGGRVEAATRLFFLSAYWP